MNQEKKKPVFVTVIAWFFIVASLFAGFFLMLYSIMMFSFSDFHFSPDDPIIFYFMSSNMPFIVLFFFILALVTLITAAGLLKRKNWARIIFIIIMAIGIILNLSAIFIMFSPYPDEFYDSVPEGFKIMMLIMQIFYVIIFTAVSVTFGWIIKKLMSQKIKQKFTGAPSVNS